jgi:hypothetical protein
MEETLKSTINMQRSTTGKSALLLLFVLTIFSCTSCQKGKTEPQGQSKLIRATINPDTQFQTIDGFGVNLNPALWNNGTLKPALDLLVDELGATQFRFDCFGRANWLEADKQLPDGSWPADYLTEVYQSKEFTDAWQTFRYLNEKGVEPYFNISGIVPQEWNHTGSKVLENFDAYSEMICTLLEWARNKENLKFSLLAPYNETDFNGTREGPAIPSENRIKAVQSMVNSLKKHQLDDLKLALFCDGYFDINKIEPLLIDSSFTDFVTIISGHTYGNGDEGDGEGWYTDKSRLGVAKARIVQTAYKDIHLWLNEYGDLDQTNEIENEFSWRITRRLMKALTDGANSCQFWDAYDNYHKHDSAWTTYGLLDTDTLNKIFTPKKRFFASKQAYRFIQPGFIRIEIKSPEMPYNVYREWQNPLKNVKMHAFKSADGKKLTIIGMSLVEKPTDIEFSLTNFSPEGEFNLYQTNETYDCKMVKKIKNKEGKLRIPLSARTIFTLTNVN